MLYNVWIVLSHHFDIVLLDRTGYCENLVVLRGFAESDLSHVTLSCPIMLYQTWILCDFFKSRGKRMHSLAVLTPKWWTCDAMWFDWNVPCCVKSWFSNCPLFDVSLVVGLKLQRQQIEVGWVWDSRRKLHRHKACWNCLALQHQLIRKIRVIAFRKPRSVDLKSVVVSFLFCVMEICFRRKRDCWVYSDCDLKNWIALPASVNSRATIRESDQKSSSNYNSLKCVPHRTCVDTP